MNLPKQLYVVARLNRSQAKKDASADPRFLVGIQKVCATVEEAIAEVERRNAEVDRDECIYFFQSAAFAGDTPLPGA